MLFLLRKTTMNKIHYILLMFFGVYANISLAEQADKTAFNLMAPTELQHFKSLLGRWRTSEESLKPDGSGWVERPAADWNFYLAMNGWAIRDEYFSPSLDQALANEQSRIIGTNIRVFDPEKGKWHMEWLNKNGTVSNSFSAQSDENKIVMLSLEPNSGGYISRITFFELRHDTFEWKVEWSKDGATGWFEVGRIHGKRR
jgi:hypothetical protein